MIQQVSLHQGLYVMDAIEGVIRAHHATLATVDFLQENVTFLKEKVQALEEQNKGLTARVAVLEKSSRSGLIEWVGRRRVTDGIAASRTVVAQQEADDQRVVQQRRISEENEKRITEEQRITEEKRLVEERCVVQRAVEEIRVANRCVELLKMDVNYPLHEASLAGDSPNVLDHLIVHFHFNVNSKTGRGYSPLHYAAYHGHTNIVELLLNRGAEVNSETGDGWTPLRYAEHYGHDVVVELLKSQGGTLGIVKGVASQTAPPPHQQFFVGFKSVYESL